MSDHLQVERAAMREAEGCLAEWDKISTPAQAIEHLLRDYRLSRPEVRDALYMALAVRLACQKRHGKGRD